MKGMVRRRFGVNRKFADTACFSVFAFAAFMLFRRLFVRLIDVLLVPSRKMDVIIEQNAAGIMLGRERWYLFPDGITDIP